MSDLDKSYTDRYRKTQAGALWPNEWVVRAFLGAYPRHRLDRSAYQGASILDLGFGDGRNAGFLYDLGFEVHGTEITPEICEIASRRFEQLGKRADFRVGRNNDLPYPDASFDYLLASHSCFYLDGDDDFAMNLAEIARVMRPDAVFVGTVPMITNQYFADSEDLGAGVRRITRDELGLREGARLMSFENEQAVRDQFDRHFAEVRIGEWRNDFWGIREHMFLVVALRRADGDDEVSD